MKIIILGIKTDILDEGAKNVATNISAALEKNNDVLIIHQRDALTSKTIKLIRSYKPDAIVSIHGPSPKTIILLRLLKLLTGVKKTIAVGTQPHLKNVHLALLGIIKPDLILHQSSLWRSRLEKYNYHTLPLSNGVDIEKFKPDQTTENITALRKSLNIAEGKKVVLHIGPVNISRGLETLERLNERDDIQVVIAGSTTAPYIRELAERLENNGLIVKNEYFPSINTLYSMSDVYVFPVQNYGGSIEIPLTVLEAMACDKPVITSRFRGLPDFLSETESLKFFDTYEDIEANIDDIIGKTGNRQYVLKYTWDNIANNLTEIINKEH